MEQELIQKIQDNLTSKLINTNIEYIDITIYYCIINNIILTINDILPNCQLNTNHIQHNLENAYILLITNEPLKPFSGNLAILLNIDDLFINSVDVSVVYI